MGDKSEIKNQLESLNQIKRKIYNLKRELEEIYKLGALPKKSDYNLPSSKGVVVAPQENFVIKIDELECKITKMITIALEKEELFLNALEDLDLFSQNMLMEKYTQGKSVKELAAEFNYSERHLNRILDESIKKIIRKK